MTSFWEQLKNGGFGDSGGLKGFREEIKERTMIKKSSAKKNNDFITVSKLPTREERQVTSRQIENLVDMVSPKSAEQLKKINEQVENLEQTMSNVIEANSPGQVIVRKIAKTNHFTTGDHLYVQRLGFTHHGIYIGNQQIIHYRLEEGIEKVSVENFALGAKIHIKNSALFYSIDNVVNRAYSRLGEDTYNLFNNNCENFVNWCRSGR